MKNIIYKYFLILSVFSLFNFACKNEPIFAAIEEEVKLKKQSIQGLVLGIVKIGNTVYSANPKNVFKKNVGDTGEWASISLPGGMCTSIASDGTKLYATFLGYGAYVYDNGGWQKLSSPEDVVQIVSGQSITSSTLFHYDGSSLTLTSVKHQVLSVWCMNYSKEKSLVLVGGSQGYKEVKVVGTSLTGAEVISPGSVSSTTPPSCYNQYNNSVGKWLVRPIALITTPKGYVIYAGVGGGDPKYTGLWGFYDPDQHEWNRE